MRRAHLRMIAQIKKRTKEEEILLPKLILMEVVLYVLYEPACGNENELITSLQGKLDAIKAEDTAAKAKASRRDLYYPRGI